MDLPRLYASTEDATKVARIIRGALRLQVERVPLRKPPEGAGEHLLVIDVPGESERVELIAEPFGSATAEGHALRVRPLSRPQMASLFALVERLDEPSSSMPPPASAEDRPSGEGPDDTILDGGTLTAFRAPSGWLGADDVPESSSPISTDPPTAAIVAPPAAVRAPPAPPLPRPEPVLPAPVAAPSVEAANVDPRLGRTVGNRYRIDALLGSGAAAAVYRARHLDLQRSVAVKILHLQNQNDPQFVRRFKAEALAASKLEHVNVTRVLDFGQDATGELYLVMELLAGKSLEALLTESGRLPQRRAVDIAVQACRALAFAHDEGIIHRDVKPENIMVLAHRDDDGALQDLVKVCDFGLAKLRDRDPEQGELTLAGMLCGSPAYMSPEQATGDPLDTRTDVYSLGVTLYECLTGAMPHEGHSLAELFLKKMNAPPRRLSELRPNVHPALDELVMTTLETDPARRPANARALLGALRGVRGQLPADG